MATKATKATKATTVKRVRPSQMACVSRLNGEGKSMLTSIIASVCFEESVKKSVFVTQLEIKDRDTFVPFKGDNTSVFRPTLVNDAIDNFVSNKYSVLDVGNSSKTEFCSSLALDSSRFERCKFVVPFNVRSDRREDVLSEISFLTDCGISESKIYCIPTMVNPHSMGFADEEFKALSNNLKAMDVKYNPEAHLIFDESFMPLMESCGLNMGYLIDFDNEELEEIREEKYDLEDKKFDEELSKDETARLKSLTELSKLIGTAKNKVNMGCMVAIKTLLAS